MRRSNSDEAPVVTQLLQSSRSLSRRATSAAAISPEVRAPEVVEVRESRSAAPHKKRAVKKSRECRGKVVSQRSATCEKMTQSAPTKPTVTVKQEVPEKNAPPGKFHLNFTTHPNLQFFGFLVDHVPIIIM